MPKGQILAVALIVGGILANNYVYLHDLIFGRHDGTIYLGTASLIAVVASLLAIAARLRLLLRGPGAR